MPGRPRLKCRRPFLWRRCLRLGYDPVISYPISSYPINDGQRFSHHHIMIMRDDRAGITRGLLNLGTEPVIVFPSLTLALNKIPHECTNQLGCRAVRRSSFGRKGVAQISFQLQGENSFFRQNQPPA
jgi:hypothetical protein